MANSNPEILIVDDHRDVLDALRLLFKGEGISTVEAHSPAKALRLVEGRQFSLALIDLNYHRDTTSGREGLELLVNLKQRDSSLPVIVMTAWGSVDLAVEAMRLGAGDFVEKPWSNERLLNIVTNQLALAESRQETARLEAVHLEHTANEASDLIAESAAMKKVLAVLERVAPSDAPILITGENGTGKGVIARAIHSLSARAGKPLVSVNMGGMSEGVFESELFGHVKGAFTDAKKDRMGRIEMAEGGTLFMDEIANTPRSQQAKLLRVLETGEYERLGSSRTMAANIRLISATNANLDEEVDSGRFRQDLRFRLNTVELHLPPLRDRRDDIAPLVTHFLTRHSRKYGKPIQGFESAAMDAMLAHSWPGNVRELNHAVERGVLMCVGDSVRTGDLGLSQASGASMTLDDMSLDEVEKYLIQRTLARFGGNARQAAEALGLSRSAFYRRLSRHGL